MNKSYAMSKAARLLLGLALGASPLASMAIDITDGGEYYIVSDYFNKALGLDATESTSPALSDFGTVSTDGAYVFVAEKSNDASYFYLRNKATGKYLTASTSDNWSVVWKDAKGTGNEYLWKLDVQMGRQIVSKKNTSAMLGIDWSTDDFVHVYYNKSYNSTCRFTVVPVAEGGLDASLAQARTSVFKNAIGRQEQDIYQLNEPMEVTDDIDLHLVGEKPFGANGQVNLVHPSAWVILDNVTPSKAYNYLRYITINGQKASQNKNVRVAIYLDGAAIIPYAPKTEAVLSGYTEKNQQGDRLDLLCKDYPSLNASEQPFDNRMRSFTLKRGFMAVVATGEKGQGYSRVFVADHADLQVNLPEALDRRISSVHIKPWQYTSKKGWCSTQGTDQITEQMGKLNTQWFYTWSGDRSSTTNYEYVPIRQHMYWPSLSELRSKEASTHVLGFNEPDHPEQHKDCSCGGTINAWDACVKTKEMSDLPMRIGSPAPTDLNWATDYFGHIDDMGYRCDFSVIHAYWGPNEANGPQAWYNTLKSLYDKTHRPIWITEWAYGASWTKEEWPTDYTAQLEKNRAALFDIVNMLESCPFVERYSYYQWDTSSRRMVNDDGWVTPAGEMYRRTRSTFAYNAKNDVVPRWWRPSTQAASITFLTDEAERQMVLRVANPMGDCTESLTLEQWDNELHAWKELHKWDDRTLFDADTLAYALPIEGFNRLADRFRVRTVTIFGKETVSKTFDMGYIVNPDCSDGTNGWTVNNLSSNKGEAADGDAANAYWNVYKESAYTSSMKQTLTGLPAGTYSLSLLIRAATGMNAEAKMTVRSASGETHEARQSYTGRGNKSEEGDAYLNGWDQLTLAALEVGKGDEVTIEASANGEAKMWWSIDDFQLHFTAPKPEGIGQSVTSATDDGQPVYGIDGRRRHAAEGKGIFITRGKKVVK